MSHIVIADTFGTFEPLIPVLRNTGFTVSYLNQSIITEAELIAAIKTTDGFIYGGGPFITPQIIDECTLLKIIVFCGTGYKRFIPGWQHAAQKGITIANIPNGPTHAVAEWCVATALAMTRNLFGNTPQRTTGMQNETIGIIALGNIGLTIAEMTQVFKPARTLYYSTHRHKDAEQTLGLQFTTLPRLLQQANIVFLCVPDEAGQDFFNNQHFMLMPRGATLISCVHPGVINESDLYNALASGAIRCASDYPMSKRFDLLPPTQWYCSRSSTAFNTSSSIAYTSQQAVQKMINLLAK